jgi:hypothetical protein
LQGNVEPGALLDTDLDTLVTELYARTDDLLKAALERAPWRPASRICPAISDAELITLAGDAGPALLRQRDPVAAKCPQAPDRPVPYLRGQPRQIIESVTETLKGQLDLECHGGHTPLGAEKTRIVQRILALTAAIWHNDHTGQPIMPSMTAYDHRPLGITHLVQVDQAKLRSTRHKPCLVRSIAYGESATLTRAIKVRVLLHIASFSIVQPSTDSVDHSALSSTDPTRFGTQPDAGRRTKLSIRVQNMTKMAQAAAVPAVWMLGFQNIIHESLGTNGGPVDKSIPRGSWALSIELQSDGSSFSIHTENNECCWPPRITLEAHNCSCKIAICLQKTTLGNNTYPRPNQC